MLYDDGDIKVTDIQTYFVEYPEKLKVLSPVLFFESWEMNNTLHHLKLMPERYQSKSIDNWCFGDMFVIDVFTWQK